MVAFSIFTQFTCFRFLCRAGGRIDFRICSGSRILGTDSKGAYTEHMRLNPQRVALISILCIGTVLVVIGVGRLSSEPINQPVLEKSVVTPLSKDKPVPYDFLEVTGGCSHDYAGNCVLAHSGLQEDSQMVARLRIGMVLKVAESIQKDGVTWYKIAFDDWVRYPERIGTDWYVSATSSIAISHEAGEEALAPGETVVSTKRIIVDRGDETLSAYEGDSLFMKTSISAGLALTPTPRGIFTVYRKTPSRYMQGPLPGISDQYYDLPGVPWNLYFTLQGGVIHGAYWHDSFGKPWSHGCVNLNLTDAQKLYRWADVGTSVIVQD